MVEAYSTASKEVKSDEKSTDRLLKISNLIEELLKIPQLFEKRLVHTIAGIAFEITHFLEAKIQVNEELEHTILLANEMIWESLRDTEDLSEAALDRLGDTIGDSSM